MAPTLSLFCCSPVVNFLQPEELKGAINFPLSDDPLSDEELSNLLQTVLKYSVKTGESSDES